MEDSEFSRSDFSSADRERIIKMDVKVDRLITDVAELNRNYGNRISFLESNKLAKVEAEKLISEATKDTDLKAQLLVDKVSRLEKIVYGCVGTILLGFLGSVLALVTKN